MGAHLHAIKSAPLGANQHEPRVFTAVFQERLEKLNRAERELRRLGLRIDWGWAARIDWGWAAATDRLEIRILRDASQSLGPLLDRMGPRTFYKELGCTTISGKFEGVTVSWTMPMRATNEYPNEGERK